jgi:hypothetical protein
MSKEAYVCSKAKGISLLSMGFFHQIIKGIANLDLKLKGL